MRYYCLHCQSTYTGFRLVCTDCGSWNSLRRQPRPAFLEGTEPIALPMVRSTGASRTKTNIGQIDALLDGGFVPGSSVLLSGPPGAGKSTLMMQVLRNMNIPALYVTGEETVQQLKLRADRLNMRSEKLYLLFESNVNKIISHVESLGSRVLIIDSIQTMYSETSDALPGTPAQIRKCSFVLRRSARDKQFILILVGQVTKDKKAAGPRLLEHAVDVALFIETGEGSERMLVASKNRFGSTLSRCTMHLHETGLAFHPISSPPLL